MGFLSCGMPSVIRATEIGSRIVGLRLSCMSCFQRKRKGKCDKSRAGDQWAWEGCDFCILYLTCSSAATLMVWKKRWLI